MCYDCNEERNTQTAMPPQVDPTVMLLVNYAEQNGRLSVQNQTMNRDLNVVQSKLTKTEGQLANSDYYLDIAKRDSEHIHEYAMSLEKKLPKKKVVKKVTKRNYTRRSK